MVYPFIITSRVEFYLLLTMYVLGCFATARNDGYARSLYEKRGDTPSLRGLLAEATHYTARFFVCTVSHFRRPADGVASLSLAMTEGCAFFAMMKSSAFADNVRMWNNIGYVYILFNRPNGALYTGVTSDLVRRVQQHKSHIVPGFTAQYNVTRLGYYEEFEIMEDAIAREKQIKAGSRRKKIDLIESLNPYWRDLYEDIQP